MTKSCGRSNGGHKSQIKKIKKILNTKGKECSKSEWESLIKRKIYHEDVLDLQVQKKRKLSKKQKDFIWSTIDDETIYRFYTRN